MRFPNYALKIVCIGCSLTHTKNKTKLTDKHLVIINKIKKYGTQIIYLFTEFEFKKMQRKRKRFWKQKHFLYSKFKSVFCILILFKQILWKISRIMQFDVCYWIINPIFNAFEIFPIFASYNLICNMYFHKWIVFK